MGKYLFDQYSYLHFAVGIIVYYWNIPLFLWFILHTLFEIVENSQIGMHIINTYIRFWPGGKPYADTYINTVGDTIGAMVGWISALFLDRIGDRYEWYTQHLKS